MFNLEVRRRGKKIRGLGLHLIGGQRVGDQIYAEADLKGPELRSLKSGMIYRSSMEAGIVIYSGLPSCFSSAKPLKLPMGARAT